MNFMGGANIQFIAGRLERSTSALHSSKKSPAELPVTLQSYHCSALEHSRYCLSAYILWELEFIISFYILSRAHYHVLVFRKWINEVYQLVPRGDADGILLFVPIHTFSIACPSMLSFFYSYLFISLSPLFFSSVTKWRKINILKICSKYL